jgi:hypothetical protein
MHYSKFSMFTLRIWVFKSGVFKNLFILSKHVTKANKLNVTYYVLIYQGVFNFILCVYSYWYVQQLFDSKFSMFTLRIWVFKSGVFKNLFILSKHVTKANIRSTKMANNQHAYNRDVIQSYWRSDGLPLYCSQPSCSCWQTSIGQPVLFEYGTDCEWHPSNQTLHVTIRCYPWSTWLEFKDMAQDPLVRREPVSASCNRWPDEGLETQKYSLYPKEHPGKSFTLLVCVCFLTSRLTTV